MNIRATSIVSFATAAVLAMTTIAAAQAPAAGSPQTPPGSAPEDRAAEQQPRMQVTPIEGELMDVDAEAKTFVIMTDIATGATPGVSTGANARVEFTYTDDTTVEGVERGVAGLADRRATRMTVHFVEKDGRKVATRIELTPATGPESAPGVPPAPPR